MATWGKIPRCPILLQHRHPEVGNIPEDRAEASRVDAHPRVLEHRLLLGARG